MHTDTTTGAVTLTKTEYAAISRLVSHTHDKVSSMPNDGDWFGWDDYRALQMIDDVLQGKRLTLEVYFGTVEGTPQGIKTVQQWIDRYGSDRVKSASTVHSTPQALKTEAFKPKH